MSVDWQSVMTTVLLGIGGTTSFTLVSAWLLKTGLKEWLARETEAFKSRLQTGAQIEVEKLRSALQITATEHQIRFSRLHEKRADVIEQVFNKLTEIQQSAEFFVVGSENNPNPQHKENSDKLRKKLVEYSSYIDCHRIFLPEEVCKLLVNHLVQIHKTVHIASAYGGKEHLIESTAQRSHDAFTKAYEALNEDIPAAQLILEREFRKILGAEPA
ncbi:MAG TPA: hypothetical protein VGK22_13695 [Candidatus Angelobacter sp.]|jgi:hypothetical protein